LRENHLKEVCETRLLMGSLVTISVVSDDSDTGKAAIKNAFYRMEKLTTTLDHRSSTSEISVLNERRHIKDATEATIELMKIAQEVNQMTKGAFDITIHPLCQLYRERAREGLLPLEEEVSQILEIIGMTHLWVKGKTIGLGHAGMAVTFDGIGKGYVIDAGAAVLKDKGFPNVLVEVGGDIMASGHNTSKSGWRIGVRSPREWKREPLILNVYDEAVATSGDYHNFYTETFQEHHILDPRTGHSASELASATVIAKTATLADALATAMMVMGIESGLSLINSLNGVEAYLVRKDMEVYRTQGLM
jgi:thiamine biosynthesis lipoprotein